MNLICFDCDSTLSEIEGVDELAAARGSKVKEQVVDLTNQAMSGEIAIEEIFAKRLDIIKPSRTLCDEVGQLYIEKISAGAKDLISDLITDGWKVVIISGGFVQPIEPFAKHLGITEVHAVPLHFQEDGSYKGFTESPTTRNGGKPEIIQALKQTYTPNLTVMVGDGVSDLETQPFVDLFIGYGEFTPREKVIKEANQFAYNFQDIRDSLLKLTSS